MHLFQGWNSLEEQDLIHITMHQQSRGQSGFLIQYQFTKALKSENVTK